MAVLELDVSVSDFHFSVSIERLQWREEGGNKSLHTEAVIAFTDGTRVSVYCRFEPGNGFAAGRWSIGAGSAVRVSPIAMSEVRIALMQQVDDFGHRMSAAALEACVG